MMKLFTNRQVAEIDRYTIEYEPIADIDLMERAAGKITDRLLSLVKYPQPLVFFAGPGNNGGDALAVARLMGWVGFPCEVFWTDLGKSVSPAAEINLKRLEEQGKAEIKRIMTESDFPFPAEGSIIIDGLFGSGLTRPLDGFAAALVRHINQLTSGNPGSGIRYQDTGHKTPDNSAIRNPQSAIVGSAIRNPPPMAIGAAIKVVSIDIPSGLMGEDNTGNNPEHIIRADHTITLQFPKISLLFPENEEYAGEVHVEDIGLHPEAIAKTETPYYFTGKPDIACLFPRRPRFAHKGTYGHALLMAGSYGKTGAALLAARACLRSGAGLVTAHIPGCGYSVMQTGAPEVMCSMDAGDKVLTAVPEPGPWTAAGAGPGLGTQAETHAVIGNLIDQATVPLVFDADALNILALHTEWLSELPENTILTPHPGEFRRLFGETAGSWQRLQLQRQKSQELGIIIVLKGARTSVSLPDGSVYFNPTGNPGMATGGSGDVLTGIILGLLAQKLPPEKAALAGVYLHGLAGDLAAGSGCEQALIASDITDFLREAFKEVYAER